MLCKMNRYRVTWVIDVYAENSVSAAKLAREVQLDPASTANVFDVVGNATTIDLGRLDEKLE